MTTAFIYLDDLEQQASDFLEGLAFDEVSGCVGQWDDYLRAHGIDPDHQHNKLAGLASTERTICREQGHDWLEEGEGGPDSGWIGATCQRCGESHSTTLY